MTQVPAKNLQANGKWKESKLFKKKSLNLTINSLIILKSSLNGMFMIFRGTICFSTPENQFYVAIIGVLQGINVQIYFKLCVSFHVNLFLFVSLFLA